ncbi:MAG: hypothetical protein ACI4EE_01055 [Lachnospiraceae bacterium]
MPLSGRQTHQKSNWSAMSINKDKNTEFLEKWYLFRTGRSGTA